MANRYLQFNVAIAVNPDKLEILKELDTWNDEIFCNPVAPGNEELILHTAPEIIREALCNTGYLTELLEYEGHGFSSTFYQNEYYLYAEEYGNVFSAATWIQTLLQAGVCQTKTGYVVLTWTETSDKPRVDEFYGGCIMISALGIKYQQNPWDWAKETYHQLRRDIAYQELHQENV